jgi:hypothetical protein
MEGNFGCGVAKELFRAVEANLHLPKFTHLVGTVQSVL